MESNMNTVCSTERKSFPERINQASEVPQTETMIPISQLLDDKGQEIPSQWRDNLTNGLIAAVVIELENGNQMFLQPQINSMEGVREQQVPSTAHFVRDEQTQEPIWRLSTVSGGSS
jgi:hypothetical protein